MLFYFVLLSKNITFVSKFAFKDITKVTKMIKTLLFSVLIIAISMALLCIKLFFDKKVKSMHIHDNPRLKDEGIHCAVDQDREARKGGKAFSYVKPKKN